MIVSLSKIIVALRIGAKILFMITPQRENKKIVALARKKHSFDEGTERSSPDPIRQMAEMGNAQIRIFIK